MEGGTWKLARKALSTASFGFNLVEIEPGGQIPEHDAAFWAWAADLRLGLLVTYKRGFVIGASRDQT
jgi:hypothetical protein